MKALPFVVAAVLAVGLSGCGGSDEEQDTSSNKDTDTAADDAADTGGASVEDPFPAGSAIEVADWTVTFGETNTNATEAVLASDNTNVEPAEGMQYVLLSLTGTFDGVMGSSIPAVDMTMKFADAEGLIYDPIENMDFSCGMLVDEFFSLTEEVPTNTEWKGSTCVSVPADKIEGGAWVLSDLLETEAAYVAIK